MTVSRLLRRVLWFAAGTAAMLVLERGSRHKGRRGSAARLLLDRIRPAPVTDETLDSRVRKKLASVARNSSAITASIEHGCVELRGAVQTRERARIVRAISNIGGVDAVVDLMTEEPALARRDGLSRRAPARPPLAPAPDSGHRVSF